MIYIHKILPLLFSPLNIVIFLIFFGLALKKYFVIYVAAFILLLLSTPYVANNLVGYLEGNLVHRDISEIQSADAVVVLGGMLTSVKSTSGVQFEWIDSDRFFSGIDLVLAKKAPYIIFVSGKLPWEKNSLEEGSYLKQKALAFGVPSDRILLTRQVQNTKEEADAIKDLLDEILGNKPKTIILVTSAFHMERAKKLFQENDFLVIDYPVDFKASVYKLTPMSFIPSAYALKDVEFVMRELLARRYYEALQRLN